ncbi:twin-arginine translocation pathway signal [Mycobacterium vicinigordonae]|uniref:Twin-arginine translocation pathway signal n=1 Tax=Mycobacterium vicinigordonae TaxID=1719132 RepID=A0A7D6E419_9MYCO|nr:twin-arginine translocation pathway signal [Mycobacterium vicinigordonae]QLL06742.1 twin-arginine translocation pathway signal [Mycobacterium vicinigordonae]
MTAEETSVVEEKEKLEAAGESRPGRLTRLGGRLSKLRASRLSSTAGAILLAALVVVSLLALGGQYWFINRQDKAVDADAAKAAVTAASDGVVAILSYSPETLERDFSSARTRLTGDFLSYYDNFSRQVIAPAATQKSLKTTAVVLRGALTEFHPNSAVVLLFVNQTTQSKDRPEPSMAASTVLVTLIKADGKWLISQFNPA